MTPEELKTPEDLTKDVAEAVNNETPATEEPTKPIVESGSEGQITESANLLATEEPKKEESTTEELKQSTVEPANEEEAPKTEETVKEEEQPVQLKTTEQPDEQKNEITTDTIVMDDFDDLCSTGLRREKNKTFTLMKHDMPSECRIKAERKLSYVNIDPTKAGTMVINADQKTGRVFDDYEYLPCNSICSHFHCHGDKNNILVSLGCGNSENGYVIPKSKLEIISDIIVSSDSSILKPIK